MIIVKYSSTVINKNKICVKDNKTKNLPIFFILKKSIKADFFTFNIKKIFKLL